MSVSRLTTATISTATAHPRFAELTRGLAVPVAAAPMFLVSGPDLVVAACRAGVVGCFPAPNARTLDDLAGWLATIVPAVEGAPGPWCVNLVAHRTYDRLPAELDLLAGAEPPLVVTALGSPRRVVEGVHRWGGLVLADVSTLGQARRALDAGVDGLVLVCAGAGGHTGRYSPFALIPEIRRFWEGPLVAGGAISSGAGVLAARALGADLAYVGTRFLGAAESLAGDAYRAEVVAAGLEDITTSDAVTGVPANWLARSLERSGRLASGSAAPKAAVDFSGDIAAEAKAWRDVWSAGHGVGRVEAIEPVSAIVARLADEHASALAALAGNLEET